MCTGSCCEELQLVTITLSISSLSWSVFCFCFFNQFLIPTVFGCMLRVLLSKGRRGQLGLSRQVYTHRLIGRAQSLLHLAISPQRSK